MEQVLKHYEDITAQIRDYADRKSKGMERYPIVRQCEMLLEWADEITRLSAEVKRLHEKLISISDDIGSLRMQKSKWDKYLDAVESLGKAPE